MKAKQISVRKSNITGEMSAIIYDLPYQYDESSFCLPYASGSYAIPETKNSAEAFEELKNVMIASLEADAKRIADNIAKIKALVLEEAENTQQFNKRVLAGKASIRKTTKVRQ